VILGTPEDLVNTWGISETLVDLSDLLDEQDEVELNKTALTACQTETGKLFAYPLAVNIHCMAVNYTALRAAGAEQLVNLDTRTWTTEEFCQAVTALYAYEGATVAPVYCGSISGDQGTRGLVTNLYDGSFTNASQTAYTWDGEEMQQALLTLSQLDGITIDSGLSSGDAIELFRDGTFQMSFCWNSDQQKKVRSGSTGVTDGGDQIEWMAFPSEDGQPQLESTLWSVGVFDNGDETKVAAAKRLVQFLCDSAYTGDAVRVTGYCAVRETAEDCDLTHVWDDDPVMSGFSNLLADLGDYVPLTPGWEEARDAWQTALMSIGAGADVASALEDGCAQSNSAMG
jgi:multiple sugar transport system substrate-binding protein